MDPETYLESYCGPLDKSRRDTGDAQAEATGSRGLTLLPENLYYSHYRRYNVSDILTLENLTVPELLERLEAAGTGRPDSVTGAALTAWLEEKERRLREQEEHIRELEMRLSAIRGGRAWRVYQAVKPLLGLARQLDSLSRQIVGRLKSRRR